MEGGRKQKGGKEGGRERGKEGEREGGRVPVPTAAGDCWAEGGSRPCPGPGLELGLGTG